MSTDTQQTTDQQQRRNRMAQRHGLRGAGFPKGCVRIERELNRFRRTVEDAVIALRGEVGLVDAALVNSAYRWERHAALATRWLRLHEADMDHSERLAYSREVARASSERDKCLALLELDTTPDAVDWGTLKDHHDAAEADTREGSNDGR